MIFYSCLLKHRIFYYSRKKASEIINACTDLHNMCIENIEILPRKDCIVQNNIEFGVYELIRLERSEMADDDLTAGRRVK